MILAGAVVIRELMSAGGYEALTVSENSLLAGMAATINEVLDGRDPHHRLDSQPECPLKVVKKALSQMSCSAVDGIQKKRARIPGGHGLVNNTW